MPVKQSAWLELISGSRFEFQLGNKVYDFRPKEFEGFRMVANIGSVEDARMLLNAHPTKFVFYFPHDEGVEEKNFWTLVSARQSDVLKFVMEIPDPYIDPLGNPRQPVYDPIGPIETPLNPPPEKMPEPPPPQPLPEPEARLDAPPSRTQQYRKKYSYSGR